MRTYRAGETVEDLCRACRIDRLHTVIVADAGGRPIRVQCDHCGSQHNYRGGGADMPAPPGTPPGRETTLRPMPARTAPQPVAPSGRDADQAVVDVPRVPSDLEALIRRVVREEAGLTPVAPAERWRGGTLVLRPGRPGVQEKAWPIDTFFHKVVMIRNRLRTLKQQVNAMELPEDVKVRLQSYVTACYGSLTSFNLLFADEADHFSGAATDQ